MEGLGWFRQCLLLVKVVIFVFVVVILLGFDDKVEAFRSPIVVVSRSGGDGCTGSSFSSLLYRSSSSSGRHRNHGSRSRSSCSLYANTNRVPEPLATEGDWTAYLDEETTGLIYYFNARTGESRWEVPTKTFPMVYLKPSKRRLAKNQQDMYRKAMQKQEAEQSQKGFLSFLLEEQEEDQDQDQDQDQNTAVQDKAGWFQSIWDVEGEDKTPSTTTRRRDSSSNNNKDLKNDKKKEQIASSSSSSSAAAAAGAREEEQSGFLDKLWSFGAAAGAALPSSADTINGAGTTSTSTSTSSSSSSSSLLTDDELEALKEVLSEEELQQIQQTQSEPAIQDKVAEARKLAQQKRKEAQQKANAARRAEEARIAASRRAEAAKKVAAQKRKEIQTKAEQAKQATKSSSPLFAVTDVSKDKQEKQKLQEAQKALDSFKAEAAKQLKKDQQQRKQIEAQAKRDQQEKAKQARLAEQARMAEEAKRVKEAKLAEKARLAEQAKLAREAKRAQEAQRKEEARLAREAKRQEEAKRKEEARLAKEAIIAEGARLKAIEEEARLAEEAKQAARLEAEQRRAEEAAAAEAEAEAAAAEQEQLWRQQQEAQEYEQQLLQDQQQPQAIKITMASNILPHPAKVFWGGEDAVFTKGQTFGVFDGVSGASKLDGKPLYSKTLANVLARNVPSSGGLSVAEMIEQLSTAAAVANEKATGASTACIASISDNGFLRAINLGDCCCYVIRDGKITKRTRKISHYFDCPYQLSVDSPDRPTDATKLNVELVRGDVILMASDGIFDNLSDKEIVNYVSPDKNNNNRKSPKALAKQLADQSRKVSLSSKAVTPYAKEAKRNGDPDYINGVGGKLDDIGCVVVRFE